MNKLLEIQKGKMLSVPRLKSPKSLYYDKSNKSFDYNPVNVKAEGSNRNKSITEMS